MASSFLSPKFQDTHKGTRERERERHWQNWMSGEICLTERVLEMAIALARKIADTKEIER